MATAVTAAFPTLKLPTGFVIVPACFPMSITPSFTMPFNSSLTASLALIFLALLYVLIPRNIVATLKLFDCIM